MRLNAKLETFKFIHEIASRVSQHPVMKFMTNGYRCHKLFCAISAHVYVA